MDNNEVMEVQTKSTDEIVKEYEEKFKLTKEVLGLIRADLKAGVPEEDVDIYAGASCGYEKKELVSKALRAPEGRELAKYLIENTYSDEFMRIIYEFNSKGVKLSVIKEVLREKQSNYSLEKALHKIYSELYVSSKESEEKSEAVKKWQKDIESSISEIMDNSKVMEEQQKKIAGLEEKLNNGINEQNIRQEYVEKIEEQERHLEDLQEKNNMLSRENAELRNNAKSVSEVAAELADAKVRLAETEKDRDAALLKLNDLEKEMDAVVREKDELVRELEAVKAQNEQSKEQKDKTGEPEKQNETRIAGSDTDYQVMVGPNHTGMQLERMGKRKPKTIAAMAGRMLKGTSMKDVLQSMAAAGLDEQRMQIIGRALKQGITPAQAVDIINCGFDLEEMEQAVQIMLLEMNY